MPSSHAALLLAALLLPGAAGAQGGVAPTGVAPTSAPAGFVLGFSVAGGGLVGANAEYTPRGLLEGELTVGYELPMGFRPEAAVALGIAPRSHAAARAGLRWVVPETPFDVRVAWDWSNMRGSWESRWLLFGAGGEVWFTDALGAFGEADLGIPLHASLGAGVMLRAGVAFRL